MALDVEVQIFEANLQEFANRVGTIVDLESNPSTNVDEAEAYREIKALFKQLKKSKKGLHIGDHQ